MVWWTRVKRKIWGCLADLLHHTHTNLGKHFVLKMVETAWVAGEVPCASCHPLNTILGLEKQVLLGHGSPERIYLDNFGTHFKNDLRDTWAREHETECVYHIPCYAPTSGKTEWSPGLLKTTLKAMGGETFKHWDVHLAKATWLVNIRGSTNWAGPAWSKPPCTVEGNKALWSIWRMC